MMPAISPEEIGRFLSGKEASRLILRLVEGHEGSGNNIRRFPPPWTVIEAQDAPAWAKVLTATKLAGAARATPPPPGIRLCLVQPPPQSDLVIDEPTTQPNLVEVDSLYRIDDAHPPVQRDGDRGQKGGDGQARTSP
jgi:hypothetical protein